MLFINLSMVSIERFRVSVTQIQLEEVDAAALPRPGTLQAAAIGPNGEAGPTSLQSSNELKAYPFIEIFAEVDKFTQDLLGRINSTFIQNYISTRS